MNINTQILLRLCRYRIHIRTLYTLYLCTHYTHNILFGMISIWPGHVYFLYYYYMMFIQLARKQIPTVFFSSDDDDAVAMSIVCSISNINLLLSIDFKRSWPFRYSLQYTHTCFCLVDGPLIRSCRKRRSRRWTRIRSERT